MNQYEIKDFTFFDNYLKNIPETLETNVANHQTYIKIKSLIEKL